MPDTRAQRRIALEDWLAKEAVWERNVRVRLYTALRSMPYSGLLAEPPTNQTMPEGCTDMQYVDACVTWLEELAATQQHYTDEHETQRRELDELRRERSAVRKFFGAE